MATSVIKEGHSRIFCWASAVVGTVTYVIVFRSWQDRAHLVYDTVASPIVFAFLARALVDLVNRPEGTAWIARGVLLVPLSVVPFGAQYGWWNASGHLTDMLLAVGGTLMARRRPAALVATSVATLVPIGYIRWFVFDDPSHMRTYNAIVIAGASLLVALAIELIAGRGRGGTDEVRGHRD